MEKKYKENIRGRRGMEPTAGPDGTYRITGTFLLWHMRDNLDVAYPYELIVVKKEESPFGFQMRSMAFGEEVTEAYGQAGEDGQTE